MNAAAFTDEVVSKVEAHGVFRVGYPDQRAAERLVKQLREAISRERDAHAKLRAAALEVEAWWVDEECEGRGGAPACIFNLRAELNDWCGS